MTRQFWRSRLIAAVLTTCASALSGAAQDPARPTSGPVGWELTPLPGLNYNSDEGFGFGLILHLYNYGDKGKLPYRYTIQSMGFLTTGGRRDFTVFFDAPDVGGSGWRLDAFAGHETQNASHFYGIGNAVPRDEAREDETDGKFYFFGRRRVQLTSNVQRMLIGPLRLLLGAGMANYEIDETPDDSPTFLSESSNGAEVADGTTAYVRGGIVWDTRDREVHTHRGTWADLLVQRADESFGGDWSFTRVTFTVRQYVPVTPRITLAERVIVQNVSGDVPFYELALVQTSFKWQEGLGGAGTMRGVPGNRFVGKGLGLSNTELRWRAAEFGLRGTPSSLTVSGFVDMGRVWDDRLRLSELASNLHYSAGGGLRLGRGPNFVVALDLGHSKESSLSMYFGLGFLF